MDNRFEPIKYEMVSFREFGYNYSFEVFVLRDKQTGVMYLANDSKNAGGGITPLLDKDGRPMTTFKVSI